MLLDPPVNNSFIPEDWQILARHWFPVAVATEVGDGPIAAVLLDEPLVVYRVDGAFAVARDICPHRGVPLSLGTNSGKGVVCAYHGLRFGAEGRCNFIPASPNQTIPSRLNLRTYPAVERYGLVWTCLQPALDPRTEAPAICIPHMPHWDDPGFQQIVCPPFDIAGFAGRQVEGFLDVAHFAFIHTETFADPNNAEVAPYTPVPAPYGFYVDYRSTVGNYPIGVDGKGQEGFVWLRHFEMNLPFTPTLTVHFPDEGRLVIMNAASPVSARKTRLFAPIARNYDTDLPVEAVYEFNRRVFEEDRRMVEAQKPECLPLDLTLEAHIPADRSSIAYRKGLRAMGFSQFFSS